MRLRVLEAGLHVEGEATAVQAAVLMLPEPKHSIGEAEIDLS